MRERVAIATRTFHMQIARDVNAAIARSCMMHDVRCTNCSAPTSACSHSCSVDLDYRSSCGHVQSRTLACRLARTYLQHATLHILVCKHPLMCILLLCMLCACVDHKPITYKVMYTYMSRTCTSECNNTNEHRIRPLRRLCATLTMQGLWAVRSNSIWRIPHPHNYYMHGPTRQTQAKT